MSGRGCKSLAEADWRSMHRAEFDVPRCALNASVVCKASNYEGGGSVYFTEVSKTQCQIVVKPMFFQLLNTST